MAYFDNDTTMSIYWNIEPTPGHAVKNISYDGIQQEIPTLPVFYNVVHVSSSVSLTAYQNTIIVDSPTTGETFTLLSSTDPSIIPGLPVKFILMDGASTSNLLAVQSGDSLNGVVNGTQVLVGQVSGIVSLNLTPTDIGWITTT